MEEVNVKLPKPLYDKALEWIKKEGSFSSVDELVQFLLREFVSEEEEVYTPEQEEEIKERLRKLGYI